MEVKAEVIEPQGSVDIACAAGSIAANFDALEARVAAILADYDGWEPSADSADDVKQCKSQRKYLNALAKELDERRKAVKREYLVPLNAFEDRANAITGAIKAVSARLDDVVKAADQAEKDAKEQELREHYEAYAGLLVPVVPYERIADPKWLNKTTKLIKAMDELEAKVDRIAKDWDALKNLDIVHRDEAEARFFETLDLGAAIARNAEIERARERIEEMKAAMQPDPEPEPIHQPENAVPMVMVISACTVEQARQIGRFCGSIGVTGVFKKGTLQEAARREHGNPREAA